MRSTVPAVCALHALIVLFYANLIRPGHRSILWFSYRLYLISRQADGLKVAGVMWSHGVIEIFAAGAAGLLLWVALSGGKLKGRLTDKQRIALLEECLQLILQAEAAELWQVETRTGTSTAVGAPVLRRRTVPGKGEFWQLWDYVHPDYITSLRKSIASAEQKGTMFTDEFQALLPDRRWLRCEGKFLLSQAGQPERMLCLITDISESKYAREVLGRDKEEFSLAFEAARLGCWAWSSETERFSANAGTRSILGLPPDSEVTLDGFLGAVHPGERERVRQEWLQFQRGHIPFSLACRVVGGDDTIHWVEMWGRPFGGQRIQTVGVILDVTSRTNIEDALRAVSGRLIEAQEQERTRIARELHDDMGQRIALLAVELDRLKGNLGTPGPELQQDIEFLAQLAAETAANIQALSHTLHSSKLEILGISAAMKSLCAEVARQNHTDIECVADGSIFLPQNISLCIYRVLQEALHNAVKHSRAERVFVRLHVEPGSVELTVRDSGTGFDLQSTTATHGLGLVSMRERVHLVNGTIMIESAPSRGTTVRVKIPLEESTTSQCA